MVNAHHKEMLDVYIEDGIIVSVKPNIRVSNFWLEWYLLLTFLVSNDIYLPILITRSE